MRNSPCATEHSPPRTCNGAIMVLIHSSISDEECARRTSDCNKGEPKWGRSVHWRSVHCESHNHCVAHRVRVRPLTLGYALTVNS